MSSWRQHALIEAPVEEVWRFVGDPATYPSYASNVIEVTGLPEVVERDASFRQVTKSPLGTTEMTFGIDELEDLREIKLRCTTSGYYSRWLLTEAQENTFLDLEIGIEATELRFRAFDATFGKGWYRRMVENSIDGLKAVLASRPSAK
jgi:hypothetical protein